MRITKKAKKKSKLLKYQLPSHLAMVFGMLILAALILMLYSITVLSDYTSKSARYFSKSKSTVVAETSNYHSSQAPQNFPEELIKGKMGEFIASQEITMAGVGNLEFVSFISRVSAEALVDYYSGLLRKQAYQMMREAGIGGTQQLYAYRGNKSFDLSVVPASDGSTVSIYQRILK